MDKNYSVNEAAERLKVTRRTMYYWHKGKKIKFIRVGEHYMVTQSEIDRIEEKRKREYS